MGVKHHGYEIQNAFAETVGCSQKDNNSPTQSRWERLKNLILN
jgi:hypothetical protein